ncbi:MAG: hypothetical protein HUU48_11970 [Flavobacteriales bacterium]|nr:hypothetical protein [Flavobacteriales bacterium]
MRTIIGIVLLLIYTSVLVRPIVPYIEYSIYKEFIVKKKCENNDKPKMQCNGKCFLAKQIKKLIADDEHPSPKPKPIKTENKEVFFFPIINCCSKKFFRTASTFEYTLFKDSKVSEHFKTPITPPPQHISC